MDTFIGHIAPLLPALVLTGLFLWALHRSHRRHRQPPWASDYRRPVVDDADLRRAAHDLDGYDRAA